MAMPDPELKSLSSSEIPAVLHISTWATRWTTMMRFCGRGLPDKSDNRMSWGTRLQPLILEQAARDLALEIEPNTVNLYRRRGQLGYTADGWSRKPDQGPGVIECKTCFESYQWMTAWNGGKTPPAYVEAQVQCQLFVGDGVTPFKWGTIACWFAGDIFYFHREPNLEFWALMEAEAAKFFADLAAGNFGEPYGLQAEDPLIAKLFVPKPGLVLDLRDDMQRGLDLAADVIDWHMHNDAANAGRKQAERFKSKIRANMGVHEEMLLPHGVRVRAKQVSRKGFTVEPTTFTQLDPYIPPDAAQSVERPPLEDQLRDILKAG
jgi:hypothetical protein